MPPLLHVTLDQMCLTLHVTHLLSDVIDALLDNKRVHDLLVPSKEGVDSLALSAFEVEVSLHCQDLLELIDLVSNVAGGSP